VVQVRADSEDAKLHQQMGAGVMAPLWSLADMVRVVDEWETNQRPEKSN